MVEINQDNDLNDTKVTNLDSITVDRNPGSNNELINKKYVDDSVGGGIFLKLNQTLQIYLKVLVGIDINNLNKNDKINITDITELRYLNGGQSVLQKWVLKCLYKNFQY